MSILRWLAGLLLVLLGLFATVAVAARYSDGPLGPLAGGELRGGTLHEGPEPDWTFATDIEEVEFQLLEPARSRITWIVVHEGKPYIPCGFVNFKLWKQWPHEALKDGRAVLRIDGKLYDRQLVKVEDPELFRTVLGLVTKKYEVGEGLEPDPDLVWIFRLEPRV